MISLAARRRDQHVDVVFADDSRDNPDLENLAYPPHQFSDLDGNIARQHLVPILRHLNKVVLNVENRMTPIPIIHPSLPHKLYRELFVADESVRQKAKVSTLGRTNENALPANQILRPQPPNRSRHAQVSSAFA